VKSWHTCVMFCIHFLTSKVLLSAYCTFIANSGVVFCGLGVCVCFYLGLSDHGATGLELKILLLGMWDVAALTTANVR
jgi:hypothetical protein